ncbi:MAG: alpha/beta fold hydrolase [Xanthomonadales bacterium]|nr:alpha/beta fold hydrolase [Xanthomonadales bacterium]
MTADVQILPLRASDGHRWQVLGVQPAQARAALLWLPALGVAARHYLPLAQALAAGGVASFIHEWRGLGSSSLRAGRRSNWGYRELLEQDLPASARLLRSSLGDAAPTTTIVGGHSLGGQLACCHAALAAAGHGGEVYDRLWLVAAGTPHWRSFAHPQRLLLPAIYAGLRWLSRLTGYLPGRRVGFAGNEARGLITDWSRVGQSGRYRAAGLDIDLDAAMAALQLPVDAVVMARDWMAPASSLEGLVARMPSTTACGLELDAAELGVAADHFAWMRQPQAVAEALLAGLPKTR